MGIPSPCQAEDFGTEMYCGRCNLSWRRTAAVGDVPDCKPRADPPITLDEIRAIIRYQAQEVVGSQHASINAGYRITPWLPALRRHAVLLAGVVLIERIEKLMADDRSILERLKED